MKPSFTWNISTPRTCPFFPAASTQLYFQRIMQRITKAENFLDFDVRMRRLAEEVLPKLSDCFLPRVYSAVGGWICVFEDTIIAHKLHHPCDIMTVEGFIELKDDADRSILAVACDRTHETFLARAEPPVATRETPVTYLRAKCCRSRRVR